MQDQNVDSNARIKHFNRPELHLDNSIEGLPKGEIRPSSNNVDDALYLKESMQNNFANTNES